MVREAQIQDNKPKTYNLASVGFFHPTAVATGIFSNFRRLGCGCWFAFSISVHARFFPIISLTGCWIWIRWDGSTMRDFGDIWIRGSPVIWHKQPLGSDTKMEVSVRRWIMACSPILHKLVNQEKETCQAYQVSNASHSGEYSTLIIVFMKKFVIPIRAIPLLPWSPSWRALEPC